jgi:hypothetical protein
LRDRLCRPRPRGRCSCPAVLPSRAGRACEPTPARFRITERGHFPVSISPLPLTCTSVGE